MARAGPGRRRRGAVIVGKKERTINTE